MPAMRAASAAARSRNQKEGRGPKHTLNRGLSMSGLPASKLTSLAAFNGYHLPRLVQAEAEKKSKLYGGCSWVPPDPRLKLSKVERIVKRKESFHLPLSDEKRRAEQRWLQFHRTERCPDESAETVSLLKESLKHSLAGVVDEEGLAFLLPFCFNIQLQMGEKLCAQGELMAESCSNAFVLESGNIHVYKDLEVVGKQSAPGAIATETASFEAAADCAIVRWGTSLIAKEPVSIWSVDPGKLKLAMRSTRRRRGLMLERATQQADDVVQTKLDHEALVDIARIQKFKVGEIIGQQAEFKNWLYVLLEGAAIFKSKGHVVKRYGHGDQLGDSVEHTEGVVVATTDCVCALVGRPSEIGRTKELLAKSRSLLLASSNGGKTGLLRRSNQLLL